MWKLVTMAKNSSLAQDEQTKAVAVTEEVTTPPADGITATNQETEIVPQEGETVDVRTTAPKEEKDDILPAREETVEAATEAVTDAKPPTTTEIEEMVTFTANGAKEEVTTPSKDDVTPKRTAGPIPEAVTDGEPPTTTEMAEKVSVDS
ncbi:hypothetical protein ANCDUO_01635 [Ancylostoma duodenale]|uniref:Uncharacterized protein n=1 Tax=Ancylostoma duodenale TaxID=51022 RepID=A0A0C2DDN0_9BILA|nr:hypothetical protein ANCDUO_01635 [Ancylostoma duodenale]